MPVVSFVNDIYAVAKHCGFGDLRDEMVRDILVAGSCDKRLLERLQLDGDFTLEKAVTSIWKMKTVHKQQALLHDKEAKQFPIDVVKTSRRPVKNMSDTGRGSGQSRQMKCSMCGKSPNHNIEVCPAKCMICRKYGRRGTSTMCTGQRKSRL